jgi:hypothetical protein
MKSKPSIDSLFGQQRAKYVARSSLLSHTARAVATTSSCMGMPLSRSFIEQRLPN